MSHQSTPNSSPSLHSPQSVTVKQNLAKNSVLFAQRPRDNPTLLGDPSSWRKRTKVLPNAEVVPVLFGYVVITRVSYVVITPFRNRWRTARIHPALDVRTPDALHVMVLALRSILSERVRGPAVFFEIVPDPACYSQPPGAVPRTHAKSSQIRPRRHVPVARRHLVSPNLSCAEGKTFGTSVG